MLALICRGGLSRPEGSADLKKPGGHGVLKIPIDTHGTASGMRHILERPEEDKRIFTPRPDEEQESAAVLPLEDVAAACRRVFARGALRLPVEPIPTHGKVLVTG